MKIVFAGVTLADSTVGLEASAVKNDGSRVYEAVDILRSSNKKLYDRGNIVHQFEFTVARTFADLPSAETAFMVEFDGLPGSGSISITTGQLSGVSTQTVSGANAVLTASKPTYKGLTSFTTYSFVVSAWTTGTPPGYLAPGSIDVLVQNGNQSIGSGASTVAVTFPSAFPTGHVPNVFANIGKPSGAANIEGTIRQDLVSITGFTLELNAPTPSTGYYVYWFAFPT